MHLHLQIRTNPGSRRGRVFTSQLYFDEAVTDRVHAGAPYAARGPRDTRNEEDGLFRRGGSLLLLPLSPDGEGYAGAFEVGLRGGRP